MTLIDPTRSPMQVPPRPDLGFGAYPEAQPFSQRAASGYQETLEGLKHYVTRKLYPYLESLAEQDLWDANVDKLIAAVNSALTSQTTDNATKIQNALTAIANADISITDPAMLAALTAPTSATRDFFGLAPLPSGDTTGATDQAALQAILDSGRDLLLRAGHYYVTGLTTPNTARQPRVIGSGKTATILEGVGTGTGGVLRYGGPSGQISGGVFESFTIKGNGMIGVKIVGVCGVKWRQMLFDGPLSEAIQLFNDAGGYTEFCSGEMEVTSSVPGPGLHYARSASGGKSFHGSGLTEGTLINMSYSPTAAGVVIDPGALPYNAPMSAHFFIRTTTFPAIQNNNVTDYVNFRGQTTVEQFLDGCTVFGAADAANWPIWHSGSLNTYGHMGMVIGPVRFVDRIWTPAASGYPSFVRRPWQNSKPLTAGSFNLSSLPPRTSAQVSVRILDGNGYEYDQLLYVSLRPNVSDGSGWVTVLATPRSADPNAKGAPVWSVANNQLVVTNANYTSTFVATYAVQPLAPWIALA